jgi:hypothetical protein
MSKRERQLAELARDFFECQAIKPMFEAEPPTSRQIIDTALALRDCRRAYLKIMDGTYAVPESTTEDFA